MDDLIIKGFESKEAEALVRLAEVLETARKSNVILRTRSRFWVSKQGLRPNPTRSKL